MMSDDELIHERIELLRKKFNGTITPYEFGYLVGLDEEMTRRFPRVSRAEIDALATLRAAITTNVEADAAWAEFERTFRGTKTRK